MIYFNIISVIKAFVNKKKDTNFLNQVKHTRIFMFRDVKYVHLELVILFIMIGRVQSIVLSL